MRRAGKIDLGETATGAAVRAGRARLLLLAADASENARKRAEGYLYGHRTLLVPLPYDKAQLSQLLGKTGCSMAACTDFGLSSAFLAALAEAAPEAKNAISHRARAVEKLLKLLEAEDA